MGSKARRWIVGVVLLAVLAGGGWYVYRRSRPAPVPPAPKAPATERILFIGEEKGETGIFVINPDGTGRRRLTPADDYLREDQFTVSADGRWLGYLGKDYTINVREIDSDGAHHLAFPMLTDVNDRPAVNADGTAVIFSGNRALQQAGTDGNSLRRLTKPVKDYIDLAPQLSPDGTRIAFLHALDGTDAGGTVRVINRDGTGMRELSEMGYSGGMRWSRDGRYLATDYVAESEDLDGGMTIITTATGKHLDIEQAVTPAFSPTEDLLTFYDARAGMVALMRPDGRDRRTVPHTRDLSNPVFSPDGRYLLCCRWDAKELKNSTLVIISRDGAVRRELTTGRYALWVQRAR